MWVSPLHKIYYRLDVISTPFDPIQGINFWPMQLKKLGSPRFPDEGEVEKEDFRFFVEFLRQYFFLFSFFNNDMGCDRNIPWSFHIVVVMVAGNLMVFRTP